MNPFWNNIYDDVKDRRYGSLFLVSLITLPLLLAVLALINDLTGMLFDLTRDFDFSKFQIICLVLLAVLIPLEAALLWCRWVRVGRKARQERLKYANLSRDELFKARSKLKNQMKPVKFRAVERPPKRAVPRSPDTDLKY